MRIILTMYLTMLSVILGGIFNMIFTKTKLYKKYRYPIDFNKKLNDNKRIFGDNKTFIGFFSMIVFCCIFHLFIGLLCNILNINQYNEFYNIHINTLGYNFTIGILLGFAYMICELPNSFIKRRINIKEGKTHNSFVGKIFFIIDQFDSMFGVIFVLYIFSNISIKEYFNYVLLGGLTHITINLILYKLKIRKNL